MTNNDVENAILVSLITPKTAKEIEKEAGIKMRTVQRILKRLQANGKVRTLSKAERRLIDWRPDESVYDKYSWDNHKTDLRIPVYTSGITDPREIRNKIDEKLKNLESGSYAVLKDIILGKFERFNPYYSDIEKLEKLSALFVKHNNEALLSHILDLCEKIGGINEPKILKKLDKQLGRDVNGKLLYQFIKEALSEAKPKDIDKIIKSLTELKT